MVCPYEIINEGVVCGNIWARAPGRYFPFRSYTAHLQLHIIRIHLGISLETCAESPLAVAQARVDSGSGRDRPAGYARTTRGICPSATAAESRCPGSLLSRPLTGFQGCLSSSPRVLCRLATLNAPIDDLAASSGEANPQLIRP